MLFHLSDIGVVLAALVYLKTAISVAQRKVINAEFNEPQNRVLWCGETTNIEWKERTSSSNE